MLKNTIIPIIAAVFIAAEVYAGPVSVTVTDRYKYDAAGRPGRLLYVDSKVPFTSAEMEIGGLKVLMAPVSCGESRFEILLPENYAVSRDEVADITFLQKKKPIDRVTVNVPRMRHWEILIYPHSHVDIGYTNPREVIEDVHKRNIEQAIILGEKTKDYPEGARFVWNTEVSWPLERYFATESPEKCEKVLEGIRKGYVSVDASYVNTNTSSAHEAELIEMFSFAHKIEKLTGKKVDTMVQVDIPGFTWGLPAIASISGIRNIISLPNGGDRIGFAGNLNYHSKIWLGPDGKSEVLFIQPGPYCDAALRKRDSFFWDMLGETDSSKVPLIIKNDNPRDLFVDKYLSKVLPELEKDTAYVYGFLPMTWCMSDNVPIDADLPDAVKSWNEEFAYPHLSICSSREIVEAYEPYKDSMPKVSGDYTEYWTDGLGASAGYTSHHREVKERLAQAEALSCMTGNAISKEKVSEAWRNAIMGTEHTWSFIYPDKPIADTMLAQKYSYFTDTDRLATDLMNSVLAPCAEQGSDVIAVFNTEGFARSGLVRLAPGTAPAANSVVDIESGEAIPAQVLSDGSLVFVSGTIAPMSIRKFRLVNKKNKPADPDYYGMDNGLVSISLDPLTGDITSLVSGGKEFVDRMSPANVNSYRYLHGRESSGYASKAFDAEISWKEFGPVLKTLRVVSSAEGCNALVRDITIVEGDGAVYLDNMVDKIAVTDKEGLHFGFAFNLKNNCRLFADVPWGVMQLGKDQWSEANRNWLSMQRWVNVSDDDANVTICSMNAPIFEVGDLTANILGSSGNWLHSLPEKPCIWSWVMNNHWHTNFALSQEGKIMFHYVLKPGTGPVDIPAANRFARSQTRALVACPVSEDFSVDMPFSLKMDPAIDVACLRPVDDGILVILHSLSDRDLDVCFDLREGYQAVQTDAWGGQDGFKSDKFTLSSKSVLAVKVIPAL